MTDAWESMVTVGRIIRPHGIRGQMVVVAETDFGHERFKPGEALQTLRDGRVETLRVAAGREHAGRWVVGFEGVTTVEDAEALRGLDLRIAARDVQALGAGAYYEYDLVGCRVETVNGVEVGPVERVDFFAGPPILAVRSAAGAVLVPLAADICRSVDVKAKVIVIDPPDGLVELNATRRT